MVLEAMNVSPDRSSRRLSFSMLQCGRKLLQTNPMHRVAAFFVYLALALSLAFGSVAHATEGLPCIEVSADDSPFLHADGDGDQVPADPEKAYPHHHGGCHGHHIGVPVKLLSVEQSRIAPMLPRPFDRGRAARAPEDPALRPPIA